MMKQLLYISLLFLIACSSSNEREIPKQYKEQAERVTIIRDRWGIPHIYGKTDADAVFGLMYAQCEESFERVERNYLQVLGRLSETEGEVYLYQDLQMKIIYDTAAAIADYNKTPEWMKKLLHAFADGINYYLYMHPEVKPAALKHFEPWFPLMFTDGAYISTNMAGITANHLKNFYGKNNSSALPIGNTALANGELTGSNAFAIAPSGTANGNALLYINPHVSFYFRTEVHMVSEEGLNAYGAVTWGQFFIFQGFNEHCGWMHTSSMADAADLYEEKIVRKGNKLFYEYDGQLKPVIEKQQVVYYKNNGGLAQHAVTVYYTHHGPVMGSRNEMWLSLKEQNRSLNGLIQSWQRTKAKDLAEFKNTMQLQANASTNTMYADDQGNIAYWHGNFIPERDAAFDWSQPVDGTTSATEWKGVHDMNETIHIKNPTQGWLQNCNSTPFSLAGYHTIDKKAYPVYMAPEGENFRSIRAITEIEKENKFTIEKLIALGYDHYLPVFDTLLPPLFMAFESLTANDPLRADLVEAIQLLRSWDKRSSVTSVATTIAIFWGAQLVTDDNTGGADDQIAQMRSAVLNTSARQKLELLGDVLSGLQRMYGSWKLPWGNINRYQRKTGELYPVFNDNESSYPVGLASAFFGSLPSYETVWQQTQKQYGVAGNSFVAVVEFVRQPANSFGGKKIVAKSIVSGGQSFDPKSKHFKDQTTMFIEGRFKDVFFYKEDVEKNAERKYRPGEK